MRIPVLTLSTILAASSAFAATPAPAAKPAAPDTAEPSARTVQYHSSDIVPIRARMKYTTLIAVPPTEKIMTAAVGDKDFWIVDVVGSFCFIHPAKPNIGSNLDLITDKGNVYSFSLQDVTGTQQTADLKVMVEPADQSSLAASTGPSQYVPAAQVQQMQAQLDQIQSHVGQAVDEYKAAYPLSLKFDYTFKANAAPFAIQAIWHDDRFTYIRTTASEKFSVYDMRDGKPNLVNYQLKDGLYVIPSVMQSGYVQLGKQKMEFAQKAKEA